MSGLNSFILDNQWLSLLLLFVIVLLVNTLLLYRSLRKLQNTYEKMGEAMQRRLDLSPTGYPKHIEATWEDIGAHGRFLTDLGGMSIKMREQQQREFQKALDTPLVTEPAAGSIADIMVDLDKFLTKQAEIEALSWGKMRSRVRK